ncbi:MAG TPA: hypothetical protein VF886_18035 [Roseiarcus sp.]
MTNRRFLWAAFLVGFLAPRAALALDWEIERNFRYFLYPSDVAAQRVARDIYAAEKGAPPTPEQLEGFMNGPAFWTTKLSEAGDNEKRWPIDWPRGADATPYDLVKQLRAQEGRPPPPAEAELDRRGWASLLVRGRPDDPTLTGSTATCWNPVQRLHNGCAVWGDYVRAPGWIVRVFDPVAAAGQTCQWSFAGAVLVGADPRTFVAATQRALSAGQTTVSGDCRELSLVVPSDPSDPKSVAGKTTVTRTMPDGSQASVTVTPRDRLVIGFGDSFTSGEGNPELTAVFSGAPWAGGNLPARSPDPASLSAKDTRAQWTDRWCHRSVYSWQIRTALAAALTDPRQSFTILPYGCSGATIPEGILYGYNGVEWSQASDKGVIGSRSEVGLAYQEICQPQAFRSYCASGAPWCGRTEPPTEAQEQAPGFYDSAAPGLRRAVMRCGPTNVFKRTADSLLIDIGINDVGFAGWAAAIILQDPLLRKAAGAQAPCFDGTANCAATQKLFARLGRRYDLLRTVLDQYMLPDFGIDPSNVIVAVYPPALKNENDVFCPQGNSGLTIATFPPRLPFPPAPACSGSIALGGALTQYPASDQVENDVEEARRNLNASLTAFAHKPPAFDVVTAYTSAYEKRGVCATTDPDSRPPAGHACFTVTDLANLHCALSAESTHVPRAEAGGCTDGVTAFLPFQPTKFEPYRSRTRLFRTMNDVFLAINQRPAQYLDQGPFGVLDLSGRATGGAFHPTAEGHSIIANDAASALCQRLGCGP